jgi:transposase
VGAGLEVDKLTDSTINKKATADMTPFSFERNSQQGLYRFLTRKIRDIEQVIKGKTKLRQSFIGLQTIPGVGLILALTIMLETGTISRFSKVGQYSSYCRKVPSKWTSNNKKKGKGNVKNGNKYLAWAFSEAAELSKRYDDSAKAFYNKKTAKTNRMVAHAALAYGAHLNSPTFAVIN